jgi:hypothetical protein
MSMSPGLKSEFEAVIIALIEAYGADRQDVMAAARRAPIRRGRKPIDDGDVVREAAWTVAETDRTRWNVALEYAEGAEGNSPDSRARRLDKKVKKFLRPRPKWLLAPKLDAPHVPFALAREAIAEAPRIARQRRVNRLIAQRLNRIRGLLN